MLIGNKCDMANERVVKSDEGIKLADHLGKVFSSLRIIYLFNSIGDICIDVYILGLEFFETSAKENINVKISI